MPPAKAAELSAADQLKRDAGYRAVDSHVRSGMVVGLGTGSTAYFAVERVGMKLASGELERVVGVPTSVRTQEQAESLGIPLATLDEQPRLDVAIDGADAVDPQLNLIKGGGGAHLREKMVEKNAAKFVVIVDESKLCSGLGPSFALPVEIVPFCSKCTLRTIEALPSLAGCEARLRLGSSANNKVDGEEPAVTDNGNYIVDLFFKEPIADPAEAAREVRARRRRVRPCPFSATLATRDVPVAPARRDRAPGGEGDAGGAGAVGEAPARRARVGSRLLRACGRVCHLTWLRDARARSRVSSASSSTGCSAAWHRRRSSQHQVGSM